MAGLLKQPNVTRPLAAIGCGDPDATPPDLAFLETVGLATRLPEWEAVARRHFEALAERV